MKRIVLGAAVGALLLPAPAVLAACRGVACLPGAVNLVATDICEDEDEDCKRFCAPFEDDPLICFP